MSEYAPNAIRKLYDDVKAAIPSAEFSGILGVSSNGHTWGYHRSRKWDIEHGDDGAADYSVQLKADRLGDGDAASALDIKLPPEQMKLTGARLRAAFKAHDPRVRALREFGGTLDGRVTFSRDRISGRESWGEWDDSHLWHDHLSALRKFANDYAALAPIARVLAGVPMTAAEKAQALGSRVVAVVTGKKAPKWTLPAGHFYGLITGPAKCHGGYFASERPAVALIQKRLQSLGFAPRVAGWADGRYEAPTKAAVVRWQRAHKRKPTGCITRADWSVLFG